MTAVLRFTAAGGGQPYQVELTGDDVANLAADLAVLLRADADRICSWWYKLRNSLSGTPTLASAESRSKTYPAGRNGHCSGGGP
jgi:hypothetical protein